MLADPARSGQGPLEYTVAVTRFTPGCYARPVVMNAGCAMIPFDSDRLTQSGLSRSRSRVQNLEETGAYPPAASLLPAVIVPGGPPAGHKRIDFLSPPRARGELGWLAHYRVLRLLGEGGMGIVFLAEDSLLSRPVALKVIRPEIADTAGIAQRFMREARATAAIQHDHIVTIYQVGQENGIPFLAMEYLKGMSLAEWLDRSHRPSVELVLRIGREIAAGLSAAHRHSLIHRDIKPANIWLEAPLGRVKILDFGMARSEREDVEITATGPVMGTPAFMAPEQARGEPAGTSSDLFSLGCLLYRLCTRRLPFEGGSVIAVLASISTETPPAPRNLNDGIPASLSVLIMRLLHKMPEARPVSAEVVLKELRSIERELLAERQNAESSEAASQMDIAGLNSQSAAKSLWRRARLNRRRGLKLAGAPSDSRPYWRRSWPRRSWASSWPRLARATTRSSRPNPRRPRPMSRSRSAGRATKDRRPRPGSTGCRGGCAARERKDRGPSAGSTGCRGRSPCGVG